jgi:hypothetical protein
MPAFLTGFPRRRGVFLSLFFLGFALLYAFTTNQNFSFDAVTNAIACEADERIRWFHPNHLLYPFIGVLYFKLERLIGFDGYAIYSLARLNAWLMAGGLTLMAAAVSRRVTLGPALLGSGVLGVTYACWHYGVDGRAIGASVFFGAAIVWLLFQLDERRHAGPFDAALLGCLSALYVFVHGIAIFHVLPVVWFLCIRSERDPRLKLLTTYLGTFGVLVVSGYVAVYSLLRLQEPFFSWSLGYAGHDSASRALDSQFWVTSAQAVLGGLWTGWRRALMFDLGDPVSRIFSHVAGVVIALVLGAAAPRLHKRSDPLLSALLVWGFLVTLFLAFWSPGQEGFRLHVFVPWGAFLIAELTTKKARWATFIFGALLFYFNFTGPIVAQGDIKRNEGYQLLSELKSHIQPGDVFLAAGPADIPNIEVLRPYFFSDVNGGTLIGRLYAFKEDSLEPLKQRLVVQEAAGRKIYFADSLWSGDVQRSIEVDRGLRPGTLEQFMKTFSKSDSFRLSNGLTVYRVSST